MCKKAVILFVCCILAVPSIGREQAVYCGNEGAVSFAETVSFTSKETDAGQTVATLPAYLGIGSNACVPAAASIVLGYYDIYKPELIPDFTSAYVYNGVYYYAAQNDKVNSVINQLAELMQTNVISPGTTVAQFKAGFTKYVNVKGYSVAYESLMTNNFSLEAFKEKIEANTPVLLFLNGYRYNTLAGYSEMSGTDVFSGITSENRHACAAYGYKTFRYYRNGSLFRTDTYLLVAFGDNTKGMLLMDISRIEDAYAIII